MRYAAQIFIGLLVLVLVPAASGPHAGELPEDPLILLAQTTADPCSICADQKRKKAFHALDEKFVPGFEIVSSEACRLVKTDQGNALSLSCYPSDALVNSLNEDEEMPQVVFTFYTPQQKLVGISDNDLTGKLISDLYQASPAGTVFEGRLRLIGYPYGDGLTFNYFQQANRLRFHCIVSELKTGEPR